MDFDPQLYYKFADPKAVASRGLRGYRIEYLWRFILYGSWSVEPVATPTSLSYAFHPESGVFLWALTIQLP